MGLIFSLAPAQVVPPAPEFPHRSATQIVPSGAVLTLAVDPHFLPSGNCPQLTPGRYGLGRSLCAPSIDTDGNLTGYWPSGNTGGPLPAVLSPVRGTPQDWASGPGDPSSAWSLSAIANAPLAAILSTATLIRRPLSLTRLV